jgi:predicted HNH restriction endonuclease
LLHLVGVVMESREITQKIRNDNKNDYNKEKCVICNRTFFSTEGRFNVGQPVVHHLIPKQKYRGKASEAPTILICSHCHKQLHKLFNNSILRSEYNNLFKIKNHMKMRRFINWIRKEK